MVFKASSIHVASPLSANLSYREEALKTLSASPFFKIWDPEVLKLYVEYGIYNDKGVYRLKTAPIHEAVSFIGMLSGAEEAWMGMMGLDERIELRWIVPGEGQVESVLIMLSFCTF